MSNTPFSDKCSILGWFWVTWKDDERNHPSWKEFYKIYDVGLPMAWMLDGDYVSLKRGNDLGKKAIEETWTGFCQALDVDENAKYETLSDMFDASPLEFPQDEEDVEEDEE